MTHRQEAAGIAAIILSALAIVYFGDPKAAAFNKLDQANLLAIVSSLFVVAIFMERSIEAILVPVRTPDRQKYEQELEDLKFEQEYLKQELIDVQAEAENDETKKKFVALKSEEVRAKANEVRAKEREIATYRLETAQRAYWWSFVFGLVISLVGVRTLVGMVDETTVNSFSELHKFAFNSVDILLTGGIIAGGSVAIDKIGRRISTGLNFNNSATDSPPQNQPNASPPEKK